MDSFQIYEKNAKAVAIQKNQAVTSEASKGRKRRGELSPKENQTKTKKLKSASKENFSPSLGSHHFPKVFKQTCESAAAKQPHIRERLIHLLAIQPLTMAELKSRLTAGGITKEEKVVVSSFMPLIARLERKLFHLKCNVWDDVDENWPHYTDEERQQVKSKKHFYSAFPPAKKSEAMTSGSYKYPITIIPKVQQSPMSNKSTNLHSSGDPAQNLAEYSSNTLKSSNNQRLTEPAAILQVEENCFIRKRTNPGKHSSIRGRAWKAPESDTSSAANTQTQEVETNEDEPQQQQQEESDPYRPWGDYEVTDFLITLMFNDDIYRKTEDLTAYKMLAKKNPSLAAELPIFDAAVFPPITKERQRRHYITVFKRAEELYWKLYAHNKALTTKFWALRAQYETAEEFSERRLEIYVRYHRCYHLIYSDDELKRRAHLDYLHELRKHLFLRVTEHDDPALAVKAKEQLRDIEDEVQERVWNTNFMVRNLITMHPIERLWTESNTGLSDTSSQSGTVRL